LNQPSVTVLMTVFNNEKYLKQAVCSILDQTFCDFEFIIVDDGSTDGAPEILSRLAKQDDRIRLIRGPNRGIANASNQGLSLARGEIIARMDSDDVSVATRLEHQVEFLRSHPDVVACSGWYTYMDAQGRRLTTIRMPVSDEEIQASCLQGNPALCHGCVAMRRTAVETAGRYDPSFIAAVDLDLYLRLGEVGKLANLPEVLLQVRLHSASIGGGGRNVQYELARGACERAWKRRGIQGRFSAPPPWRPGEDAESQHNFLLMCGWWAFNSGERRTAIIYGCRAVQARTFNAAGWNLLVCALLKPLKAKGNQDGG